VKFDEDVRSSSSQCSPFEIEGSEEVVVPEANSKIIAMLSKPDRSSNQSTPKT
jgi:hypothetical protein